MGSGGERERIRSRVDELARAGVLVVLVILDRAGADASITATQSVKFAPGGAVVRAAYLDDYPFPFYVVVRDVRTLPDVLADAVRQWFEASAGGA